MKAKFSFSAVYQVRCELCNVVAPGELVRIFPEMEPPHPQGIPGWTMAYGIVACPRHKIVVTISTDGTDRSYEFTGWQQ